MTLQDLGNIGEFVGAIGVVTSFVYLAIQIRQNTRAVRLSSMQSANLSIGASLSIISQNSENAEVFRQGLRDFDGLSEKEQGHFGYMMMHFLTNLDSLYWEYTHSELPSGIWERERKVLQHYLKSSGGKQTWVVGHRLLSQPFVEYVQTDILQDA